MLIELLVLLLLLLLMELISEFDIVSVNVMSVLSSKKNVMSVLRPFLVCLGNLVC